MIRVIAQYVSIGVVIPNYQETWFIFMTTMVIANIQHKNMGNRAKTVVIAVLTGHQNIKNKGGMTIYSNN